MTGKSIVSYNQKITSMISSGEESHVVGQVVTKVPNTLVTAVCPLLTKYNDM